MKTLILGAVAATTLFTSSQAMATQSDMERNLSQMLAAQIGVIQVELKNATKSALTTTVEEWKQAFVDSDAGEAETVTVALTSVKPNRQ